MMPRANSTLVRTASLFGIVILFSACAAGSIEPIKGFTCCNLRLSGPGWISSQNVQGHGFVPAGEVVELTSMKRSFYVYGTVGGVDMGLRDDAARNADDTMRWVRRIVVDKDPRAQLATWPTATQAAIRAGKIVLGMSRAQVLMALGPPSPLDTPDATIAVWRYWTATADAPVDLRFAEDGALAEIKGTPEGVRVVVLRP